MILSKQVRADYSKRPVSLPYRTPGFYGHTPKFWNCRTYHWTYTPIYSDDPDFIRSMEEYVAERKAQHANCRIPWHVRDVGYLVYVLPEGKKWSRIVWWYMGNPFRDKTLEFQENRTISWK